MSSDKITEESRRKPQYRQKQSNSTSDLHDAQPLTTLSVFSEDALLTLGIRKKDSLSLNLSILIWKDRNK